MSVSSINNNGKFNSVFESFVILRMGNRGMSVGKYAGRSIINAAVKNEQLTHEITPVYSKLVKLEATNEHYYDLDVRDFSPVIKNRSDKSQLVTDYHIRYLNRLLFKHANKHSKSKFFDSVTKHVSDGKSLPHDIGYHVKEILEIDERIPVLLDTCHKLEKVFEELSAGTHPILKKLQESQNQNNTKTNETSDSSTINSNSTTTAPTAEITKELPLTESIIQESQNQNNTKTDETIDSSTTTAAMPKRQQLK
jgi:hypothetical protein